MPWFDDPRLYYDGSVAALEPISQGDILIAPTAVIAPGLAEVDVAGPQDLGEIRKVTLWRPISDEYPAAPALSVEAHWGLAMVVPHPCAMEKEWNQCVREFIMAGVPQADAEQRATAAAARGELDPFITVAPLIPYDLVPAPYRRSIAEGNRLGFFPVCPDAQIPAAYVDFNQMSTLREILARTPRRIRALSEKARAKLQLSLSQHFAWRAKSNLGDIENAVGRSIEDVTCVAKGNKLVATFLLDDGSTLTLEGNNRAQQPGSAPERPARV